jgi:3-oxoacyl-[acyl-carrier protein] reductase
VSRKLAGEIALITGGSRGIGRATALAFAAEGADIAFCHLNDDAKADETAGEIRALGRRALHRSIDVADIAAGRSFAGEAARELGPVDILFNNAGMNIRKKFEDYTEADYDRILDVHVKGMFFMAQAVYPAMAARGRGCIINIASQRGIKGAVNSTPYCAAKAAIIGFTRALACEATPKGVRVNAIAPGPIVTDLTATMAPEDRQAFIDALPVHRFGRPEEIAATALLLAGPEAGFYVGATLSPNGGDVMY